MLDVMSYLKINDVTPLIIQEVLSMVDTDNIGCFTFRSILRTCMPLDKLLKKDIILMAFKDFDDDMSGAVSPSEFIACINKYTPQGLQKVSFDTWKKIFMVNTEAELYREGF